MERLHMLCRSYEIPENLIEIEITESAFIEYPQAVINMEAQIKQMGFLLSMDDFGTGYSSLSMLKDIPVDIIKLDCQFFQSKMSNREKIIISNIIYMAKELNIQVVSE